MRIFLLYPEAPLYIMMGGFIYFFKTFLRGFFLYTNRQPFLAFLPFHHKPGIFFHKFFCLIAQFFFFVLFLLTITCPFILFYFFFIFSFQGYTRFALSFYTHIHGSGVFIFFPFCLVKGKKKVHRRWRDGRIVCLVSYSKHRSILEEYHSTIVP